MKRDESTSFDSLTQQQGLTMARYAMASESSGIITITETGFYRITATCYTTAVYPDWIGCRTYINGDKYLETTSTWGAPGFMHSIIQLEVFDTVYFDKVRDPILQGGTKKNYFTIEKLL